MPAAWAARRVSSVSSAARISPATARTSSMTRLAEALREPCCCARGIASRSARARGPSLGPLLDEHRKPASPLLLSRTIGHEVAHAAEQGMGLGCSVLRQQKVAVLRQQVSTMPGFRVDESRQRQIDGLEHLVGVLDQGGGVREAEYWRRRGRPRGARRQWRREKAIARRVMECPAENSCARHVHRPQIQLMCWQEPLMCGKNRHTTNTT